MIRADLELLLTHFTAEKEYIKDGYYRIRKNEQNDYELAFLLPDSCGTTIVSPQITVTISESGHVIPLSLLDHHSTPMRRLSYSEETATELEEALTLLVTKFKQAKALA